MRIVPGILTRVVAAMSDGYQVSDTATRRFTTRRSVEPSTRTYRSRRRGTRRVRSTRRSNENDMYHSDDGRRDTRIDEADADDLTIVSNDERSDAGFDTGRTGPRNASGARNTTRGIHQSATRNSRRFVLMSPDEAAVNGYHIPEQEPWLMTIPLDQRHSGLVVADTWTARPVDMDTASGDVFQSVFPRGWNRDTKPPADPFGRATTPVVTQAQDPFQPNGPGDTSGSHKPRDSGQTTNILHALVRKTDHVGTTEPRTSFELPGVSGSDTSTQPTDTSLNGMGPLAATSDTRSKGGSTTASILANRIGDAKLLRGFDDGVELVEHAPVTGSSPFLAYAGSSVTGYNNSGAHQPHEFWANTHRVPDGNGNNGGGYSDTAGIEYPNTNNLIYKTYVLLDNFATLVSGFCLKDMNLLLYTFSEALRMRVESRVADKRLSLGTDSSAFLFCYQPFMTPILFSALSFADNQRTLFPDKRSAIRTANLLDILNDGDVRVPFAKWVANLIIYHEIETCRVWTRAQNYQLMHSATRDSIVELSKVIKGTRRAL